MIGGAGSGVFFPRTTMGNKAIIWDYDGTLVDTWAKNFNVTKRIMHHLSGGNSMDHPALRSLGQYIRAARKAKNWRDLYKNEFVMNEDEIDKAGSLWTEYQLSDESESRLFEGVEEVVRSLSVYPMFVFSQNSSSNIAHVLEGKDLRRCFVDIVGYEEVPSGKQKPAPDGLLLCLDRIGPPGCDHLFFIGDHETDTLCGYNANAELRKRKSLTRIINVAALYGSESDTAIWNIRPDHVVKKPREILELIKDC